jgi:uncharacterized repeat protein (TIGR01451 family)
MALIPPASDCPFSPSIKPRLFAYHLYLESLWTFAFSQGKMLKPLNVSQSPGEESTKSLARLTQLVFTLITGTFACIALLLLFTPRAQSVQAAPPARPLADIITGGITVTHTPSTMHQMSVFRDGRITDQYFTDNGVYDQIGTNISATTIAVLFDQHISPTVDVGSQLEFSATTPITLNTDSSIPGYSEDSYVVYASRVISYEITQRTLATNTHNCVIMELVIRNTGSITTLTGGKLLYMVDIQVGEVPNGDKGSFDPARRLVYQTDYNVEGYAMGISLLEGDLRGYGIMTDTHPNFPDPRSGDARIRDELSTPLVSPTDVITVTTADVGDNNLVSWLVANIPDLDPHQATTLAFGLCARNGNTESEAAANMSDTFSQLANLSVSKTATPTVGSSVVAGERITYSIAISNTGYRYVNNIIVTDTVPTSTDLITYSVSQGSITASNRLITATIGRLYPTSGTVTVTLVVAPSITSTNGTLISNQAFIKSEPIITNTNIITHQIINAPVLTVTKRADPEPVVSAGEVLTYTIVISCGGQGYATGVFVSDTLPANTQFVSNSIALDPPSAGITGTVPPTLASDVTINAGQSVTVTFAVTVNNPLPAGMDTITNTVVVTSEQEISATDTITTSVTAAPDLVMAKDDGVAFAAPGDVLTYTLTISNVGNQGATGVVVTDTLSDHTTFARASDGGFEAGGIVTWSTFSLAGGTSVTRTVTVTVHNPLPAGVDAITNTAQVADDGANGPDPNIDNNIYTHTTPIEYAPALSLVKEGPTAANVGDTMVFTFTVTHASGSDGSPVSSLSVTDTIASPVNYVSGDTNSNNKLDATETWLYTAAYTILPTDSNLLTNTATVTGQDGDGDSISDTASHTTHIEFTPALDIDKDGPATANVSETVVFTFTVTHASVSDGSLISSLSVTDTIASPVNYVSGDTNSNNKLDATETWLYTAAYTILPTDPDPLVNVGTATALDEDNDALPVVTATHSTAIEYAPALTITKTGPTTANVGDTVVFTFTVSHDIVLGDRSPITNVSVTDDRAGSATYVSGDDGDDELEWGESWTYTVSYTIQRTDDNPLVNTGTVTGEDGDGDHITATDAHTTTLRGFAPALNIVKQGLTTAKVGDTVVFTFTVANVSFTPTSIKANANGDGSPISNVTVTDTIASPVNYVDGDDSDRLLEMGERWVYTASYTIQATDPDPLVNTGTVTGEDRDGDPINDTDTHNTTIEGRTNFVFLPIFLKNY